MLKARILTAFLSLLLVDSSMAAGLETIGLSGPPDAAVAISGAQFMGDQAFGFMIAAHAGIYLVERSSDLTGWLIAGSVTVADAAAQFVDFHAEDGHRFYRVVGPRPGDRSDQELIAEAGAAAGIGDCLNKASQGGLDVGASVNSVGSCDGAGQTQWQVIFFGGPHCPPNQACPLFVKIVAQVTFDCDGSISDAHCSE